MERFETLDSLRGICAIFVVFFHMNIVGAFTELSFFRNSSIFVEFFFVLSGFVLAHSYLSKERVDTKQYLISRFFRIYPMHFLMLILFLSMHLVLLVIGRLFDLKFPIDPFTGRNAYSEIIPNLTLIHAWFSNFERLSFNGPSWSISIEFYLYILFLIGLVFCRKNIILFSIVFMCFGILGVIIKPDLLIAKTAFYGLSCFFSGILAYVIYQKVKINSTYWEPVMAVIVVLFIMNLKKIPNSYAIAPFLFSFVVYVFAHENGVISKLLKIQFFRKMGELSFSIYMVHYLIISVLLSVFVLLTKLGLGFASKNNGIWNMNLDNVILNNILPFILLSVIVAISLFTRRYVEDPFIKIGKKLSKKPVNKPASSSVFN